MDQSFREPRTQIDPRQRRGVGSVVAILATLLSWAALAFLVALPGARAEVTPKDVQVMLKVVGFLNPPFRGKVPVAIVFDAGNEESKKDADTLKGLLDAAQNGPVALSAKLAAPAELATLDTKVVLVMVGLAPSAIDVIFAAVQGRRILTISTDPACPKAGKCVVSVRTNPKVEILFSDSAAQGSGIEFQPIFRMMMTRV